MIKEIMKYSGFVENAMKQRYAYKFKAFVFSISPLIFMLIQYYLWKAIFESNNGVLYSISMNQYLAYVGIGLLVENLTLCQQDLLIGDEVKSGSVANNLLKPFSYMGMIFARHLGDKVGELVSLIPIFLVVVLGIGVNYASPIILIQVLISLIMAFVVMFLMCYLTGILAFWSTNTWGLHFLRKSLTFLFSGQAIAINLFFEAASGNTGNFPLPLVSEGMVKAFFKTLGYLSYCLPFQSMYYVPTGIYTGILNSQKDIFIHMCIQVFWVAFMLMLTKFLWGKAQRKISILGG